MIRGAADAETALSQQTEQDRDLAAALARIEGFDPVTVGALWYSADLADEETQLWKGLTADPPRLPPLSAGAANDQFGGRANVDARRASLLHLHAFIARARNRAESEFAHDPSAKTWLRELSRAAISSATLAALRRQEEHDTIGRLLANTGGTESGESAHSLHAHEDAGLTPSRLAALESAGVTAEQIAALSARASQWPSGGADAVLAQLDERVRSAERTRALLLATLPHASWPLPPHLGALLELQRVTRRLSADGRRNETRRRTTEVRLRSGLLEALQRRARFSRLHRGAFAAPLDGAANDSGSTPASWHTGDRVCFAWHTDDRIVVATFDPRGELVSMPEVVAEGAWPRLACDGVRTAVAYRRPDGFGVRTHDGVRWGDERRIDGLEVSLAFAPDGPLLAATSSGVWQLADDRFDSLLSERLDQPAIVADAGGRAVVATCHGGEVIVDGTVVGRGTRPSLGAAADGSICLAYLDDAGIVVRTRRGTSWSDAWRIDAPGASWPVAAVGPEGQRVSYLAPAAPGPEALWIARHDRPVVLMPSLAGNVTDAWLTAQFTLRSERSSYRPHDVWLSLNDARLAAFRETAPEGRMLLRVSPHRLFMAGGAATPNRISIRSWHMNSGHYAINTDYRLIMRTSFSERFGFAAHPDELRQAAPEPGVNANRPDLMLVTNALRLPVDPPPAGLLEFPVSIVNLGEAASKPCRVVARSQEQLLATLDIGALEPGEWCRVRVPLDYDGHLEEIELRLEQPEPDFDPSNDNVTLRLWRPSSRATAIPSLRPVWDFSLPSATDASLLSLSDYSGRVVLVNWWRTTCGLSQAESPRLVELYRRYRDRGLTIIGVSDDNAESIGGIPAYLARYNITWPVGLHDQAEFRREILALGREDTPGNYLVTRAGRIAYLGLDRSGEDWRRVQAAVAEAIDQPAPRTPLLTPHSPSAAPPLALPDLDGRIVDLADMAGRPVVVYFFNADTCAWAGDVVAHLHGEYAQRGLQVIGVNLFDEDTVIRESITRFSFAFPVLRGAEATQLSWLGTSSAWGTFFVGRDGGLFKRILYSIDHGLERSIFARYAEQLLRAAGGDQPPIT